MTTQVQQQHELPRGTFLVEIGSNGSHDVIPHVGAVLIDPTSGTLPVANTLAGGKVLDACLVRRPGLPPKDVVRALVIPDKDGPQPPAHDAAYLQGARVFDGENFHRLPGKAREKREALREWVADLQEVWADGL